MWLGMVRCSSVEFSSQENSRSSRALRAKTEIAHRRQALIRRLLPSERHLLVGSVGSVNNNKNVLSFVMETKGSCVSWEHICLRFNRPKDSDSQPPRYITTQQQRRFQRLARFGWQHGTEEQNNWIIDVYIVIKTLDMRLSKSSIPSPSRHIKNNHSYLPRFID